MGGGSERSEQGWAGDGTKSSGAAMVMAAPALRLPPPIFSFRGGYVGSHSVSVFDGFNLIRVSIYSDLFFTAVRIFSASSDTLIVIGCVRPVAGRPVPNAVPGVCCLSFIYKNITL